MPWVSCNGLVWGVLLSNIIYSSLLDVNMAPLCSSCSRKEGWGQSEEVKSVAIKGEQKGELLERGGNLGDIVGGAKKADMKQGEGHRLA